MVVLLNGAFGIGKTTIARLVAKRLPHTALFDPEMIGYVLQRARKWTGRPVEDFQDLVLWRRVVVRGVQMMAKVRRNVIVPMAFSNASYLEEMRSGIAKFEPNVIHICLVAPIEIVRERLARRNIDVEQRDLMWQQRRAEECCVAHRDAVFAEHLHTDGLTAEEVADQVLLLLHHPSS